MFVKNCMDTNILFHAIESPDFGILIMLLLELPPELGVLGLSGDEDMLGSDPFFTKW